MGLVSKSLERSDFMFKKTCTVILFLFFDLCFFLLAPRIQADILGKARTGWDLPVRVRWERGSYQAVALGHCLSQAEECYSPNWSRWENTLTTFFFSVFLELQDNMEIYVNFTRMFLRALVDFWRAAMNPKLLEKFTFYKRSLFQAFPPRDFISIFSLCIY